MLIVHKSILTQNMFGNFNIAFYDIFLNYIKHEIFGKNFY